MTGGPDNPTARPARGDLPVAHRFSHQSMHTTFEVFVVERDATYAGQAARAAFEELDRLADELSRFHPGSDVSRIVAAALGERVRVGPATLECLATARELWKRTGGAFDATVGPVVECRREAELVGDMPSEARLAEARRRVGMDRLLIDTAAHEVAALEAGMSIDLGAIGKGFALDRMRRVLAEWSLGRVLLHGGWSTVLAGRPPKGQDGWPVAAALPEGEDPGGPHVVELAERALSGSAQGEAPHIVDPRTGRPAAGKLGAWAVAPTAMVADGFSTALAVMEPDEIADVCDAWPDIGARVVIEKEGGSKAFTFGLWT